MGTFLYCEDRFSAASRRVHHLIVKKYSGCSFTSEAHGGGWEDLGLDGEEATL